MELAQLYSRGTKMAEVDPDFRGMPLNEWQWAKLSLQAETHRRRLAEQGFQAPIESKPITRPRDEYGMKGLRGR